ncbi:hypothetical protein SCYAM73S_01043 [Streptomyces cyaneofuscatus]
MTALHVRVVGGTVNVVGTDEPGARLEVSAIEGPPLLVTHEDGRLTVAYEDLPWQDFLRWLDPRARSAVVSLACRPPPRWRSAWSAPGPWSPGSAGAAPTYAASPGTSRSSA